MLCSVCCSISTHFFYWFLQNSRWICEAYLVKWRQNVRISEMFLSLNFDWCWVLDLWIHTSFRCICYPFSNKYFVFLRKEVRSLTFSHIIDPMPFKVITTSLCQDSVTTSFSLKPHTFIDIPIFVDHSSLSMRMIVHPHTVISVSWFVKHSSSALLLVWIPISSILSS